MRLKTKLILAAVPTAAAVIAGTAIVVIHKHRKKRRKTREDYKVFMSDNVRHSLEELCKLNSEDFIPDGLGSSLYQRRLETLGDAQLLGVYVAVKLVEVLRGEGLSAKNLSKKDLKGRASLVRSIVSKSYTRQDLLVRLGSIGVKTVQSMLRDALTIARLNA